MSVVGNLSPTTATPQTLAAKHGSLWVEPRMDGWMDSEGDDWEVEKDAHSKTAQKNLQTKEKCEARLMHRSIRISKNGKHAIRFPVFLKQLLHNRSFAGNVVEEKS
ncbi:hypothetical protein E2C01_058961 [Portunus trituberculatus]|uniref:Uncharacterized protein n=1 Tax=Portunus trituberculatus TaxID=210409 RepID=A0A5B7H4T7_PORTR|nr:hypothetical protein [Portunus trituberculatus]